MKNYFLILLTSLVVFASCHNEIIDESDCCSGHTLPHYIIGYREPRAIQIRYFEGRESKDGNGYTPSYFQMTLQDERTFKYNRNNLSHPEFLRLATVYGDTAYNIFGESVNSLRDTIIEVNIFSNSEIAGIFNTESINNLILTDSYSYKSFIENSYDEATQEDYKLIPLNQFNNQDDNYLLRDGINFFFPDSIQSQLSGDYEFYFEYRSTDGKVLRDTVSATF